MPAFGRSFYKPDILYRSWAIAVKPPVEVDNGECGSDGIPMVAAGTLVLVAAGTLGLSIVIAPPTHPLFSISLIIAVFYLPRVHVTRSLPHWTTSPDMRAHWCQGRIQ